MKRSEILKRDKAILMENVNNYVEKNEAIKSKLKSLNNNELDGEDTFLINSIYARNHSIIESIDTARLRKSVEGLTQSIDTAKLREKLEALIKIFGGE